MGRPALLDPSQWVEQTSLPEVDRDALVRLGTEYRSLLDQVRRERPVEGTTQEEAALRGASSFGFSISRTLGTAFLDILRMHLNETLTDLVRKEFEVSEPERKLALRHIEHAVHVFGVLMESVGAALAEVPLASLATLLDELNDHVRSGEVPMSETDRVVLRFQLDVMVAFDVLDAPLDELTYWAYRAMTGARRVEANPNVVSPAGLRGELARIRARRSWMSWDQEEVAKELAPWPKRSQ